MEKLYLGTMGAAAVELAIDEPALSRATDDFPRFDVPSATYSESY